MPGQLMGFGHGDAKQSLVPAAAGQPGLEFGQAGVGTDLVEALPDLVSGQLLSGDQALQDLGQVKRRVGGPLVEGCGAKNAQAIIDVAHLRQAVLFVVNLNRALCEDHVAGVVAAFVLIDGHQTQLAAAFESSGDGSEVDGQVRIAVEDKEGFAEQRQGLLEGPAGAEQHRPVEGVLQFQAVGLSVAKGLAHSLAQMAQTEHDAGDALSAEQFQLVGEKRFASDWHEHFGSALRNGTQAGGQAAGEDGYGKVKGSGHGEAPKRRKRLSGDDQFGSLEVEAEADFFQAGLAHGMAQFGFSLFGIKHEESSAAGADEFAAKGAAGFGQVVPLIDLGIGHAAASGFFALPMLVHQAGELAQVA